MSANRSGSGSALRPASPGPDSAGSAGLVGFLRSRGQDQGLGQDREGPGVDQVAEAVAGEDEDIDPLERPGIDRTPDRDLSPLARRPFAALRGNGLEDASIAVADGSDRDRKPAERLRRGPCGAVLREPHPTVPVDQRRQDQRPTPPAPPTAHPRGSPIPGSPTHPPAPVAAAEGTTRPMVRNRADCG